MTILHHHIRGFAHQHDEIPAFHAAYLILTLITAALLNLGAFAVLIALHMGLDIVKYRDRHALSWRDTMEGVLRESLIDVTLLLVGLTFSLYLHHTTALVGVSGLMRTARVIVRMFGPLIPKFKILHNMLKIMSHFHHYMQTLHPGLHRRWHTIDKFCFFFSLVCLFLILMSPSILNVSTEVVRLVLLDELIPWRI